MDVDVAEKKTRREIHCHEHKRKGEPSDKIMYWLGGASMFNASGALHKYIYTQHTCWQRQSNHI